MEKSIAQMAKNFASKIIDLYGVNLVSGSFASLCTEVQREACALGTGLLARLFAETDEALLEDRNRKERFHVERKRQIKRLQTEMGEVELKRTLFKDKKNGNFRYLADELLDIDKYQRIDKGLKAKLIRTAADVSYGKAGELSGGAVSRQTVMNIVHKLNHIKAELTETPAKVSTLYVEADEDHIHLQNGKGSQIRLVYVHEGKKEVEKNRKELIHPKFFTGYDSDKLWEEVSGYVQKAYETEDLYIQLQGDGAPWIQAGLEWLPNAEFVLDKFHIFKSLTKATGHCRKLKTQLIKSIRMQDETKTAMLFQALYDAAEKDSDRKEVTETEAYVMNNFDDIHLLEEETVYNGCSAEGHVSHLLSSRLSSRPMGWSQQGAERIAALRAYKANQGNFLSLVSKSTSSLEQPSPMSAKRYYNKIKNAIKKENGIQLAHVPILEASTSYGIRRLVQQTIQTRLKY